MEGRTKSSGFKMKAGAEGPMKKNFPSAFKNRGVKDGSESSNHSYTTGPRGSLSSYSSSDNLSDDDKRSRDVNTLRSKKLSALYGPGGYLSGLDT